MIQTNQYILLVIHKCVYLIYGLLLHVDLKIPKINTYEIFLRKKVHSLKYKNIAKTQIVTCYLDAEIYLKNRDIEKFDFVNSANFCWPLVISLVSHNQNLSHMNTRHQPAYKNRTYLVPDTTKRFVIIIYKINIKTWAKKINLRLFSSTFTKTKQTLKTKAARKQNKNKIQ